MSRMPILPGSHDRTQVGKTKGLAKALLILLSLICFTPAHGQTITQAIAALKSHITGVAPLTAAQIKTQGNAIQGGIAQVGSNSAVMTAAFDLVSTYETEIGALFVTNATKNGFARDGAGFELEQAMFDLEQGIIDHTYTAANLALYENFLNGRKFNTSSYFPGAVAPPANPATIQSAQINASQPQAYGAPVMYEDLPARRPTGCYLAPGSIATVTVPAALVNKGFTIRVGAHSWDLSAKDTLKRHDRVSIVYPITTANTKIASPLGGGIYIEVPYLKTAGVVTVQLVNVVRSPFFSATSHHKTTQTEWMNGERTQPGPWADFESDKFMMQVPRDWIHAFSTPVTLMQDWDKAMDAVSELMGLPLIRSKTVMYVQPDVLYRTTVNAPGYPMSNDPYNFNTVESGNKNHYLLNGPQDSSWTTLHELGHAQLFTKFTGEQESAVHMLYVAAMNQKFGVTLNDAMGLSIGAVNTPQNVSISLNQAALTWILVDKFRAGQAMADTDMKYQHRGHGKYVEIASLFGWKALNNFWRSVQVDYENGIDYPENSDPTDSRILRMSKAAGVDLRPLIHFWGIKPANAASLATSIQNAGLQPSLAIYNRLKSYQTIVPATQSEFETHYGKVDSSLPASDADWYRSVHDNNTWTSALANASIAAIQDIIDLYFPNGVPVVATQTWDVTPGTVGAGNGAINSGTGTWNATAGTWTTNGGANNIAWADGSDAIFGTGTYTVNLGSGVVVRNLTVGAGAGNVTLKAVTDNNALTLAPAPVWNLNDNSLTMVADQVNDTGLTMYGASTLTVTGTGTFNTGEKPTGADWSVGGCTLAVNGTLTLRGNAGSVGMFETVRMPAASTFIHERNTGQTYANRWELTGAGQVTFENQYARLYNLDGVISGTAGMIIGNLGQQAGVQQYVQFINANTYTGLTTVMTGGMLKLSGGADRVNPGNDIMVDGILELNDDQTFGSLTGTGSVINHGVLTIGNNTAATTAGCVISGTGSLIKTGTGQVTLTSANAYSGSTIVQNSGGTGYSGALRLQHASALGSAAGSTTVETGTRVELDGALGAPVAEPLVLNGNGGNLNPGALRNVSGNNTWSGPITLGSSARIINAAAGTTLTLDVASGNAIHAAGFSLIVEGTGAIAVLDPVSLGAGALTKNGAGTLTLAAVNSFTGTTTINAGTLSLASKSLANGSDVSLAPGAVLHLNFTGTDAIDELFINGVRQNAGTWGSLASSAANKTALITGTGLLDILTGPFQNWALTSGLNGTSGNDPAFASDPDGDGIANGLEWILGGNPLSGSTAAAPRASTNSTHLTLTFTRVDESETGTTLVAQWGGTLAGWTGAAIGTATSGPDANGVTVTIAENGISPDTVVVSIPRSLAGTGGVFVRLQASLP